MRCSTLCLFLSLAGITLFHPFLSAQLNMSLAGQLGFAEDLSDIWGWRNPVDGKEYALVGVFDGFSIVDISNPAVPVQVHFVPGDGSIWRDIKTWDHYAYVTNETGGGLLIVDLANLPGSINTWSWTGGSLGFQSAHNLFIDEAGIAYICGSNGSLGTLFLDLPANPTNPTLLGSYTLRYVHDLYVRGDTIWTAEINNGIFSVIDVSNKSAPFVMATQETTSTFTHNIWVSADATLLVTTDEVSSANIDAYDVADISDIQRIDTWKSHPGSGVIPHNTFIQGNYLLTSYYRDGVTLTDAHYPDNLIQTGFYDTSPLSGDGFNGAWGVYPYLPSGLIIASDIENGLFVLNPTYQQAAYLRGLVRDSVSGAPIPGAGISILATPDVSAVSSNITGLYATGTYAAGTYTVRAEKYGYASKEYSGILLNNGMETALDIDLVALPSFTQTGVVLDSITGQPVAFAQVALEFSDTIVYVMANADGQFSRSDLLPGNYSVYAGHWNYRTSRKGALVLDAGSGSLILEINRGLYDDFLFDFDWTVEGTATTGDWERGIPIGTNSGPDDVNPYFDLWGDFGEACYVTGNAGGSVGNDDVDNGYTRLRSPLFDLSRYGDPRVAFDRWFYNGGGSGFPDDSLIVTLSNGIETVRIDLALNGDPFESQWRQRDIRVLDFLDATETMQFAVYTADRVSSGHLVEGGLDAWSVYDAAATAVPDAAFTASTSSPCAGTSVEFSDASVGYPLVWKWSFPGGTPTVSYDPEPGIFYPAAGTYDVRLTVFNGNGTDSISLTSYITVLDSLELTTASTPSTTGFDGTASVVDVTGGTPPYTYAWNDPLNQSTKNAVGLSPGIYEVTVTSSEGCQSTVSVTVGGVVSGIGPGPLLEAPVAFPNPFLHTVLLQNIHPSIIHWEVLDALGRLLLSGRKGAVPELGELEFGASWSAGTYFWIGYSESGAMARLPLIKGQP